jgi:hypothetical protein
MLPPSYELVKALIDETYRVAENRRLVSLAKSRRHHRAVNRTTEERTKQTADRLNREVAEETLAVTHAPLSTAATGNE